MDLTKKTQYSIAKTNTQLGDGSSAGVETFSKTLKSGICSVNDTLIPLFDFSTNLYEFKVDVGVAREKEKGPGGRSFGVHGVPLEDIFSDDLVLFCHILGFD